MPRFKLRWRYLYPSHPLYLEGHSVSQVIADLPPYALRIAERDEGAWELSVLSDGHVMATGVFPNSGEAARAAEAWATRAT